MQRAKLSSSATVVCIIYSVGREKGRGREEEGRTRLERRVAFLFSLRSAALGGAPVLQALPPPPAPHKGATFPPHFCTILGWGKIADKRRAKPSNHDFLPATVRIFFYKEHPVSFPFKEPSSSATDSFSRKRRAKRRRSPGKRGRVLRARIFQPFKCSRMVGRRRRCRLGAT